MGARKGVSRVKIKKILALIFFTPYNVLI